MKNSFHRRGAENTEEAQRKEGAGSPLRFLSALHASAVHFGCGTSLRLIAPKLYDDFTLARSIVEVDQDNLLPGSKH